MLLNSRDISTNRLLHRGYARKNSWDGLFLVSCTDATAAKTNHRTCCWACCKVPGRGFILFCWSYCLNFATCNQVHIKFKSLLHSLHWHCKTDQLIGSDRFQQQSDIIDKPLWLADFHNISSDKVEHIYIYTTSTGTCLVGLSLSRDIPFFLGHTGKIIIKRFGVLYESRVCSSCTEATHVPQCRSSLQ